MTSNTTPKVNEYLLRISAGLIVLPEPLSLDQDIRVVIDGTVTQYTDKNNNDGTVNRIYTLKGIIAEESFE